MDKSLVLIFLIVIVAISIVLSFDTAAIVGAGALLATAYSGYQMSGGCPPPEGFDGREILSPLVAGRYSDDSVSIPLTPLGGGYTTPAESDLEGTVDQQRETHQTPSPYGACKPPPNQWGNDQGYTNCYNPVAMEFMTDTARGRTVDEKSMTYGQMAGARAKKVIEGYASKNMYYYKKNFDDELSEHEKKRWWGNEEF